MVPGSENLTTYFDKEELLKRVMNNHDLITTLLNVFIDDIPVSFDKLTIAVNKNNYEELVSEAHNIKGSSYNITANQVGDVAKEIESYGKAKDMDAVKALLPDLKKQIQNTIDYFNCILDKN